MGWLDWVIIILYLSGMIGRGPDAETDCGEK